MSRRGISDAQADANAAALERRGRTYADPNAASFRVAWDAGKRGPRDLRHAVELVRRAYRDEVPTKLHSGQELADDGTPKMTPKAEAYIFGSATWTDAGSAKRCTCGVTARRSSGAGFEPVSSTRQGVASPSRSRGLEASLHTDDCPANPVNAPLVSFYLTPFRARLDEMERHTAESTRKHAAIVRHVTIGGQSGEAAAIVEGVPSWCSRLVAKEALTVFLNGLSDVHVARESSAA